MWIRILSNKIMRTTLILISFILITTELLAQGLVRGRVIDGDTGEPMFSYSVVSIETGQGETTDFDGRRACAPRNGGSRKGLAA